MNLELYDDLVDMLTSIFCAGPLGNNRFTSPHQDGDRLYASNCAMAVEVKTGKGSEFLNKVPHNHQLPVKKIAELLDEAELKAAKDPHAAVRVDKEALARAVRAVIRELAEGAQLFPLQNFPQQWRLENAILAIPVDGKLEVFNAAWLLNIALLFNNVDWLGEEDGDIVFHLPSVKMSNYRSCHGRALYCQGRIWRAILMPKYVVAGENKTGNPVANVLTGELICRMDESLEVKAKELGYEV